MRLERQESAAPVDDATKAAIEQAQAEKRRGEGVTLAQSNQNLKKRLKAWRKAQDEVLTA